MRHFVPTAKSSTVLPRPVFRVSREEIDDAYSHVSEQELNDMKSALANIRTFAEAQRATIHDLPEFQPRPGILLGHRVIPVQSCCCYVPGGRFPLYSSAMMLITPAKVAGVKRIVTCSPVAHGTGTINDKTLVAMDLAGADEIYALGGVQAIAAFSYGTESILPVDVIVGPGNQYVAEAKRPVLRTGWHRLCCRSQRSTGHRRRERRPEDTRS